MDKLSSQKPFRFLLDTASADIREFFGAFGVAARPESMPLAGTTVLDLAEALRLARNGHVESRRAAVAAFSTWLSDDVEAIRACYALAFDDPQATVRGLAWFAIAEIWSDGSGPASLSEVTLECLVDRFGLAPGPTTALVTRIWLDAIDQLVKRAQFGIRRATDKEEIEQLKRNRFSKLLPIKGGSDLPALESGSSAVRRFLHHSNPDRRAAAILIVWRDKLADRRLISRIAELAETDRSLDVQIAGVLCLRELLQGTGEPDVVRALARIVRNEANDVAIRGAAYQGLFTLLGKPLEQWPTERELIGSFRFPDDVDWELVNSCLH